MTTHVLISPKGQCAGPCTLRQAWRKVSYLGLGADEDTSPVAVESAWCVCLCDEQETTQ